MKQEFLQFCGGGNLLIALSLNILRIVYTSLIAISTVYS